MQAFNKEELHGYNKLCLVTELKEKSGKRFLVDDVDIAVYKVEKKIYALGNICPHRHSALIYDGFIEDDCVVCPLHGWKFNLKDGKMPTGTTGLSSYEIKIFNDEVFVKIVKKELKW
ncbi:MAG: nitrite reductase (NAD(P)H) small subunit [Ignavibacteriaceae bacterium]|nr:nitrite reductase (NAD(P)H) small subunit [Ignavibacteriaceae bacterium]